MLRHFLPDVVMNIDKNNVFVGCMAIVQKVKITSRKRQLTLQVLQYKKRKLVYYIIFSKNINSTRTFNLNLIHFVKCI